MAEEHRTNSGGFEFKYQNADVDDREPEMYTSPDLDIYDSYVDSWLLRSCGSYFM